MTENTFFFMKKTHTHKNKQIENELHKWRTELRI